MIGGNTKSTATPYLGAFVTTPTINGPGSEPAGQGYTRILIPETAFTNAVTGATQLTEDLIFPMATGNWGQIVGFGIFDSSVGGNCLAFFHAADVKLIERNDRLVVLAGGLQHSFTGNLWSHLVKNQILNDLYNYTPIPVYPTIYCAVFTTAPTTTTVGVEPAANGYTRIAVANSAANFSPFSGGFKLNSTVIQFPVATGNWGTITHFGWFDADTGGQFLLGGVLTNASFTPFSKEIETNDILQFPAGSLRHSIAAA